MHLIRGVASFLFAYFCVCLSAVAAAPDLARGVNFYLHPGLIDGQLVGMEDPLNQFTPEDAKRLRGVGITHIRLAVVPYPLLEGLEVPGDFKNQAVQVAYLKAVHGIIQRALNEGIGVVLGVMANDDVWRRLNADPDYAAQWDRFFTLWAEEFHHYAPERLALETLNEPRLLRLAAEAHVPAAPWAELQARWLKVLRRGVPHHALVAVGEEMSSAYALMQLPPIEDDHLIYALHDYDPFVFTHQGADWAGMGDLRGVRYPPNTSPCAAKRRDVTPGRRDDFDRYCAENWDESRTRARAQALAAWAKARQAPVWLSEFGVYPAASQEEDALRYLRETRRAYEEAGIGWCAWEYANWMKRLDSPALRAALGLKEIP